MTRINTNVSSLTAQKTLARTNVQLQEALTRLSTGLRINSGKDDPAGLIASEILRSDIVSTQKAISNTERANQMIATADSALGQVSSLLNDIRGLVEEAANKGALSDEQISANQLQIDSSLSAINRISQTTKFQGRGLIDGSLDFITTASTISTIEDFKVNQANLGAVGQVDVNVDMTTAATQATITSASGDALAVAQLEFSPRARLGFNAAAVEIDLVATTVGPQYEGVSLIFVNDLAGDFATATYDQDAKTITVHYDLTAGTTAGTLVTALDGLTDFEAVLQTGLAATVLTAVDGTYSTASPSLNFEAATVGADYNGVSVSVQASGLAGGGFQATWFSASKRLVVTIDNSAARALATVATDLDTALSGIFNVTATGTTSIRGNDASILPAETKAVTNSGISGYIRSGFSAATRANATLSFAPAVTASLVTGGAGTPAIVDIKSKTLGTAANGVAISFLDDVAVTQGNEYAVYDSGAKTLVVHYLGGTSTVANVVTAINALDDWTAVNTEPGEDADAVAAAGQSTYTTATDTLEIAALNPGADYNHIQIKLETVDGLGTPRALYDATAKELTIQIDADGSETLASLKTAVDALAQFSAAAHTRGPGRVYGGQVDATAIANTSATGGNTLLADMNLEIAGKFGAEVFNFNTGTSVNQMATAISLVSDSTSVSATQSNGLLTMTSIEYGSKQFAAATVTSEGTAGTFKNALSDYRATGTDAVATINGIAAVADGNVLSIITSTLDLSLQVTAGSTADFNFAITGGGALFQIGPEVVANQQSRMGIQSVNTARLGGADGMLYQLASGQAASLANNVGLAAKIVDEATTAVTTLRGRLGAFQKTTLDTNAKALNDTLEALTAAESSIRDADFAAETAKLTRAQILSQSGLAVLAIANRDPQNVLALLR